MHIWHINLENVTRIIKLLRPKKTFKFSFSMNLNVKSANNNNNNNDTTDEFEGPSGKTSMRPPHSPGPLVTKTQEIPVKVANLVAVTSV